MARRATACRKRRTSGPFRTRDGDSSPPDGLEGCGAACDKASWYPKGSQPPVLDRAADASDYHDVANFAGQRVVLGVGWKVRDWWQTPKCVFCILSESTTLYNLNVVPVPDGKPTLNFGL